MVKPKLEKLMENPGFSIGALDIETGIMFHEDMPLAFVALAYPNSYRIYVSVFEDRAPDDHLVITEAETLEEAQSLAEEQLSKIVRSNLH